MSSVSVVSSSLFVVSCESKITTGELELEMQRIDSTRFAPEGRDVYSLAAFSLFEAPYERIALACRVEGSAPGFRS
jgi:hypothetical protein